MKLASVRHRNRDLVAAEVAAGELVSVDTLLALPAARGAHASGSPGVKMRDLIRGGAPLLDALRAALAAARAERFVERIPASEVTWHPPVRRPGKICAVAMNNSSSNERKISAPDHPAFFLKPASCLVGHGQPIRIRRYYGSVHPEPELALVIGRETRDVPARRALEAVFGYTIFNDITGNGMRAEDRFHYWAVYAKKGNPNETERVEQHLSYAGRYKGTDTFGAMGPWLVTKDEIAESRRSRRAVQGRRRARRRGQHALLQLQGGRGRELHQPVPHAASGRRRFARHRVQARRESQVDPSGELPDRRGSGGGEHRRPRPPENPVIVEDREIGE